MTQHTRTPPFAPLRIGVWVGASPGAAARAVPADHRGAAGLGGLLEGLLDAGPDDAVRVVLPPGERDSLGTVGRSARLEFLSGPPGRFPLARKCFATLRAIARRTVGRVEAFGCRVETAIVKRLNTCGRLVLLGPPFLLIAAVALACFAAWQVAAAVLRTLNRAATGAGVVCRRLAWPRDFREARAVLDRAACDVWLVPSPRTDFPFSADVRCVLLVDGTPSHPASGTEIGAIIRHTYTMPARPHARATLYLVQTPAPHLNPILPELEAGPERVRVVLPGRSWGEAGRRWRAVLAEAAVLPLPGSCLLEPPPCESGRRYRVRLFLPQVHLGGVWEAMRILLAGLVEVNRRRGAFDFTLALPASQPCVEQVECLDGLEVEWLTKQVFTREEARPLLDALGGRLPEGEPLMLPWSPSAAGADAWFALLDRLSPAVLPARPLGVLVHDVIQRHVPEAFPARLFQTLFPAIRASARAADRVMTTNPATRLDAIDEFGLDPERVGLVPVACEPQARFAGLEPQAVPVPDGFVLNITNVSPHKGAEMVLRAHALLRRTMGDATPPLVICGVDTDQMSPSGPAPVNPSARRLRAVVGELGLREGRDVWFLGYLRDEQLLDLFRRCAVVVNAAKYDNGTYSLIEGHYFGKPTVCTRYPAAEALYERFEVPVHYYAMGDVGDLAAKIGRAAREPALAGEELARVRARLADPRHGGLRYAEEVYALLLDLCRRGRREAADAA